MRFTSFAQTKKGFTLIELLVVIAIFAMLSAIVFASLATARQKGRDGRRLSDMHQVQLALELYFDTTQSYPPAATSPYALPVALVNTKYMARLPSTPFGGVANYKYFGLSGPARDRNNPAATSIYYVLAAELERHDNPVLNFDADYTVYDTTGASVIMRGNSAGCNATAGVPQPGGGINGERCFDLRP